MIVAYACIRTSIMYKCSKFVFCARNVKSQQKQNMKFCNDKMISKMPKTHALKFHENIPGQCTSKSANFNTIKTSSNQAKITRVLWAVPIFMPICTRDTRHFMML